MPSTITKPSDADGVTIFHLKHIHTGSETHDDCEQECGKRENCVAYTQFQATYAISTLRMECFGRSTKPDEEREDQLALSGITTGICGYCRKYVSYYLKTL